MPRELFLHIGAHKTGTTAIQDACHRHIDRLRARNWDFAFEPGRPLNWGNIIAFDTEGAAPDFRVPADRVDRLRARLADTRGNVILSAEDLFFLDGRRIAEFCAHLTGLFDRIRLIAYLRRQDELAVSQKAQGAKTLQSALLFGLTPNPLPDLTPAVRNYLSFSRKLAQWQAALPEAELMVRQYHRKALKGGDIVADFFALLGLDLPGDVGEVNATMGANAVRLLLSLRAEGLQQGDIETIRFAEWLEPDDHSFRPTEAEARAFLAEFDADNAALPGLLGADFGFHDDFSRYPAIAPETGYDDYERRNLRKILGHLTEAANSDTAVALRIHAQRLEATHPRIARDLIALAYKMKPHGPTIREHYARMLTRPQKPEPNPKPMQD